MLVAWSSGVSARWPMMVMLATGLGVVELKARTPAGRPIRAMDARNIVEAVRVGGEVKRSVECGGG